jgi:hypothetical protein
MRLMRWLASAGCLSMAACAAEPPEQVALRYQRLEITRDRVAQLPLISHADSLVLASAGNGTRLRVAMFKPGERAELGAVVDSARVVRQHGDSADVAVYTRVPNWESIGGRWKDGADRSTDPEIAASVPKVTEVTEYALVREHRLLRSRWRIAMDAAFRARTFPLQVAAFAPESSLAAQARAATELRRLFVTTHHPLPEMVDSMLAAVVTTAAYADSISYSIDMHEMRYPIPGTFSMELGGRLVNHSARPLEAVVIRFHLTSGEDDNAYVSNVAPGASTPIIGYGRWRGDIARHRISEVRLAK